MRNLLKKADLLVTPYEFNINQRQKSLTVIGTQILLFKVECQQYQLEYLVYFTQLESFIKQFQIKKLSMLVRKIQFQIQHIQIATTQYLHLRFLIKMEIFLKTYQKFNSVQYVEQKRDAQKIGFEKNSTNLLLKKCQTTTVNQFNFDVISISNQQKQNLYCADGDYYIKGQYFDAFFSYLKIQIKVCKNITNINCKPIEEIQSFIKSGLNVDLFVRGSRLQQQFNLSSPLEYYPINIFWKFVIGMSNNEDIFIMPFSMDLKSNSIFYDFLSLKLEELLFQTTTFDKQERRLEPTEFTEGSNLCSFFIRSSPNRQYFFISKSDLFSIFSASLSQATALAVAIMSFLKIFYRSYNQHKTFAVLMNSVFKFDLESVQKKRQSSIHYHDKTKTIFQQQRPTNISQTGQLQQILNFEIAYSFIQYIKYLVYKLFRSIQGDQSVKTEKEIIISQIAKSKIQYDLDLTNILKKLYEIDCLKLFFFDDDQLVLFNTFCSPVFQDQMINQKDLFDILTNQQQQQKLLSNSQQTEKEKDKRLDLTFVASSEIPINVRLAKVARFFKAQLGASNAEGLVRTFQRINENQNQNFILNQKLLSFAKQNSSLFRLVQSQYESIQQQQAMHNVPNEIDSSDKNSIDKDSAWSMEVQSYQIESEKRSAIISQQQV
ncbi:unnamed protein product (macronuclear) [Paramecium tetraurelia]|uniref:Transmembrane protein n=1 Tax=Paramecium tetraurelia TaxID=5888 RepID=A0D394_PARTE|nr:uncharacterized protein GSPATT00012996001 [Paramecium tetraurelia]CAK77511.1 unnamed protein product [Paramecium tetraurelia]|eukprot:XP_001444908.1 hypothetical protein (macronuclear) [Paramecium tetraurelia strain d4-2]